MNSERWYNVDEKPRTDWETFALRFAEYFVQEEYDAMYSMLSDNIKTKYSVKDFEEFHFRYSCEGEEALGPAHLQNSWGYSHDDVANDKRWSYVTIGGFYCEAITVQVTKIADNFFISDIDWGRP